MLKLFQLAFSLVNFAMRRRFTILDFRLVCAAVGFGRFAVGHSRNYTAHVSDKSAAPNDRLVRVSLLEAQTLTANALHLMSALPRQSVHRKPLLHFLARGLPSARAAELFVCSASTISKSQQWHYDPNSSLLLSQRSSNTQRQRISSVECKQTQQLISDHCPPKSGTSKGRQFDTDQALFAQYKAAWPSMAMQMINCTDTDEPAHRTLKEKGRASAALLAFLQITRTPKPGQQQPLFRSFVSHPHFDAHLIDMIIAFVGPLSLHARCLKTFVHLKEELKLRRVNEYHGQFDCVSCGQFAVDSAALERLAGNVDRLTAVELAQLARLRVAVARGQNHKDLHLHQSAALRQSVARLATDEAVLQLDFGALHREPNVVDKDKSLVHVLMAVIHTRPRENAEVERNYIALTCEDQLTSNNDFYFERAALSYLLLQSSVFSSVRKVSIWSDTGAKSFRSRYEKRLEAELSVLSGKEIVHNYTAARHGHSICDAMLGVLAQATKRWLIRVQGQREQHQPAPTSPLRKASDFIGVFGQIRRLTQVVFPTIDRTESLKPKALPLSGIMKMHQISFNGLNTVHMRKKSGEGAFTTVRWRFKKGSPAASAIVCFPHTLVLSQQPHANFAARLATAGLSWSVSDADLPLVVGPLAAKMPHCASLLVAQPAAAAPAQARTSAVSKLAQQPKRKRKNGNEEWTPRGGKRVHTGEQLEEEKPPIDEDFDPPEWQLRLGLL